MGSVDAPVDVAVTKSIIQNDKRDVKDLWNEALKEYKSILGEELRPNFVNVNSMINYGVEQMNNFHRFRHDASKVDKLRTLFMGNIHYIEMGTSKLISAATPAFPPAAAIGTAVTFILQACKSVSADYNVVTAFFEDMNSFLKRVSILEQRLPQGTYETFLMDVFTALLRMCAIATKFIRLGRLKKWIINAFHGDDSELAGARKKMDKSITILQSATEFQILANSEDTIRMQEELKQNQEAHRKQADEQLRMLQSIQEGQTTIVDELDEIKQLLLFRQQERSSELGTTPTDPIKKSLSRVRSVVHEVPGHAMQLQMIRQSHVEQTCEWLWDDVEWKSWETTKSQNTASRWLLLQGPPGIGKSHLAVVVYDRLMQRASQQPGNSTCTAYAFCRDTVDTMASLKSALNSIILQIADQNIVICEQLNIALSKDDFQVSEEDFFHELIMPIFAKDSKYQLNLVIDSINELTDQDQTKLNSLLSIVEEQQLNIRAVFTAREGTELVSASNATLVSSIHVTKAKVLLDLKKVISSRLQSLDSAYQGLTRLSRYVKSKVASVLEEKADGILYAEYMIRHLSSIGREGAIVKELDTGMPDNTNGLYEKLMLASQRKTPANILPAVKSLLAWVAFSFDPLTLAGANLLVQNDTDNMDLFVEDQIQDILNRFLWIGSMLPAESDVASPMDEDGIDVDPTFEQAAILDDGQLEVVLRERSMREYFQQAVKAETSLRTYETVAHKEIFLFCCQIISRHRSFDSDQDGQSSRRKILDYALKYCLQHWLSIKPTEIYTLSDEDKLALCEAFYTLISDDYGFAYALETTDLGLSIESLFDLRAYLDSDKFWEEAFPAAWGAWANVVSNLPSNSSLKAEIDQYWKGSAEQAFIPLASAHLRNWLNAMEYERARSAYNLARKTIRRTSMRKLLHQEFPKSSQLDYTEEAGKTLPYGTFTWITGDEYNDEILQLRKAASIEIGSNAHYATSVIMNNFGLQDSAISEMETAVKTCVDAGERARDYIYMARIYSSMMRGTTMLIEYIDMALQERKTMSNSLIIDALKVKADAWTRLCNWDKAIEAFLEIRSIDFKIWIPTEFLGDEFWLYTTKAQMDQDPGIPLNAFLSWKPIQRLALLTDFASTRMSGLAVHKSLLESALSTRRINELIVVYEDIIKSLDIDGCGAVWRKQLASIYWRILDDTSVARDILKKVLDSSSKGQEYSLGKGSLDAGLVAIDAVNAMCDILYQLFRDSNSLETKTKLLNETKTLSQRHLVQTVQIGTSLKVPHLLTSARMIQKVGSPEEYQTTLRKAFDTCWENLHDVITWNDSSNVVQLAKVLSHMPSMKRDAELLLSSQLYYLEPHTEAEMLDYTRESEYGYYCNIEGVCKYIGERWKIPACHRCGQTWLKWDDNEPPMPMYTCLLCTDSVLCPECHGKRMEFNSMEKMPENEPSFCCKNGQYLKSPMEGWKGVKFGVVHIEDQEPIAFSQYLDDVKVRWEAAWQEFWIG